MAQSKFPYRLLTPGPVPIHPDVLKALAEPVRHHRTPEFLKILDQVWQSLSWIYGTKEPVMLLTATGSGAMEAALVNCLSPGDEVLSICAGKFGERWAEMAERFGLIVQRLDVPWGEAVNLGQVEEFLRKNRQIKAVLTQAVETSTATVMPVKELSELTKKHTSALFMVDAITGLGAMDLPFDQWNIDVMVAGSQKALMLPTGLSFIALSKAAWSANETAKCPRYYFDLKQELKANKKGQTFFSSANSHIVALDVVLQLFKQRGLTALKDRCAILAEATRESAKALGLSVFSKSPAASVTALNVPQAVDGAKLRDLMESKFNVTVMGGQDQLQGKILRFGHLGYVTDEDALFGFSALANSLSELGWKEADARRQVAETKMKEILSRGPRAN